jgi:FkbM family methyltransferase
MTDGIGRGLRFDPGSSNPEYGRGSNELPVQDAFARHVRKGDVVFDVGANVGFFSIIAAKLTGPSGSVVAFEPVHQNAGLIRRNASLNGMLNVSVIEKAVAESAGTGELVLAQYSGGAALSTATRPPDSTGSIEVDIISIDGVVATGEVPVPQVVKIDVEGAELAVLRGMRETLGRDRPIVICEIDDATRTGFDRKYEACVDFLQELAYAITPLEDSYSKDRWIVGHFVATPPLGDTS